MIKNPKTTLLGIALGLIYALAAVVSKSGTISVSDITTALIPAVLGILSADPSSFVDRFLLHWRTTAGGIVTALGSLVGNQITTGHMDLKSLAIALIIAVAGILAKDGDRSRQPDARSVASRVTGRVEP